jgi:hypothetical protein
VGHARASARRTQQQHGFFLPWSGSALFLISQADGSIMNPPSPPAAFHPSLGLTGSPFLPLHVLDCPPSPFLFFSHRQRLCNSLGGVCSGSARASLPAACLRTCMSVRWSLRIAEPCDRSVFTVGRAETPSVISRGNWIVYPFSLFSPSFLVTPAQPVAFTGGG